MMKLGIFAKTFKADNLETLLEKIVYYELTHVQFNMQCAGLDALPESIPESLALEIDKQMQEKALQMAAVSGTFNMIHPDQEVVKQGLKSLGAIAGACANMGTQMISLCTGTRDGKDKWHWHPDNARPKAWKDLLTTMTKALEIAERYDLYLGVEPEMANVVRTPELALQLIHELQTDRIKIILDPANLFEKASRPEIRLLATKAIALTIDHLAIVHAKDRTVSGQFKAAGKGDVDFPHFIQTLKQTGYEGPVILHGLTETEVGECVGILRELVR